MQARDWPGHEVTSRTQAVQSTAAQMQARDWPRYETNKSDTRCTEYCCLKNKHKNNN